MQRITRRMGGRGADFTLIELLVVVAIIAMLASMLLPALRKAQDNGKRAVCQGALKQIGIALAGYVDDNDENFCASHVSPHIGWWRTWDCFVAPYLSTKIDPLRERPPTIEIFSCPGDSTIAATRAYEPNYGNKSQLVNQYVFPGGTAAVPWPVTVKLTALRHDAPKTVLMGELHSPRNYQTSGWVISGHANSWTGFFTGTTYGGPLPSSEYHTGFGNVLLADFHVTAMRHAELQRQVWSTFH